MSLTGTRKNHHGLVSCITCMVFLLFTSSAPAELFSSGSRWPAASLARRLAAKAVLESLVEFCASLGLHRVLHPRSGVQPASPRYPCPSASDPLAARLPAKDSSRAAIPRRTRWKSRADSSRAPIYAGYQRRRQRQFLRNVSTRSTKTCRHDLAGHWCGIAHDLKASNCDKSYE